MGMLILVHNFEKGSEDDKKRIFDFYMASLQYINNWDLVDLSAPKIAGAYLFKKDCKILYNMARSKNLWKKRVAMVATYYFIKNDRFDHTMDIAKILLHDTHDLIHKAVGWMLREVGKRDVEIEKTFLDKYAATMPRTALRYAIEKFPEPQRQKYLQLRLIK